MWDYKENYKKINKGNFTIFHIWEHIFISNYEKGIPIKHNLLQSMLSEISLLKEHIWFDWKK